MCLINIASKFFLIFQTNQNNHYKIFQAVHALLAGSLTRQISTWPHVTRCIFTQTQDTCPGPTEIHVSQIFLVWPRAIVTCPRILSSEVMMVVRVFGQLMNLEAGIETGFFEILTLISWTHCTDTP